MPLNLPRISILTVTRENLLGLRRTMESIFEQSLQPAEIIVVDGASTDGTADYLGTFGAKIQWLSEPDAGISDAFNKALQKATGDWVIFLNSGDRFAEASTLATCQTILSALSSDIGVLCGRARYLDTSNIPVMEIHSDPECLERYCSIAHQATFVRRDLHSHYLFNMQLNNGMDYDLWLRLRNVTKFQVFDLLVSNCEWGGVSTDPRNAVHAILLEEAIRWVNFSKTRKLTLKKAFHIFLRSLYVRIKLALLRK